MAIKLDKKKIPAPSFGKPWGELPEAIKALKIGQSLTTVCRTPEEANCMRQTVSRLKRQGFIKDYRTRVLSNKKRMRIWRLK